jgi:D-lactate dehydrogenase
MNKLAIFGASADDKTYFTNAFSGGDVEVAFYETPIDLIKVDKATEALSVFVNTPVSAEVISGLPDLKLIACRSTGFNNIDTEAAKAHNVTVANVPSYGGSTVAEYAFILLMMLTRRMRDVLQATNTSEAERLVERGSDLAGKTIGIIGTGSIGLGVARIAKGFGMNILGYDVYPRPEEATKIGFSYAKDVDELLAGSDVISLHMPYLPENHHFMNTERFGKLRKGAILINTARGELVDTQAMVQALQGKQLGGAGLDVLEREDLLEVNNFIAFAAASGHTQEELQQAVAVAALQRMSNVIVTNHNAFNSREALERINQTTAENIKNFFAGQPVHSV